MVAARTVVNGRQKVMNGPNSGTGGEAGADTGDEFALISRLRAGFEATGGLPPPGEVWIGDDAAVVGEGRPGPRLLATDLVVGGVHADLSRCGPDDVGYKAVMVTVSDLAAMGGRPDHLLLSIAAPPGTDLDRLGAGAAEAAAETGCVVVGGDLSTAPVLVVSVAVLGSLHGPVVPGPLLRSGAAPGDVLLVTGPLGASAAGLRLLHDGHGAGAGDHPSVAAAVLAHRRPVARLDEGEVARLAGASAAVDVSDGLVADLRHLATASGVGVELDDVPAAPGASPDEALAGGEEYELVLATADPDGLRRAFAAAGLRPPVAVGRCTDRAGRLDLDGRPLPAGGWRHRFA